MVRFFVMFILIQAVLFTLDVLEPVRQVFVLPFTELLARASAAVVTVFDARVHAEGIILRSLDTGFAVSIQPGCNGIEASIVLIAAMLAFPAPWKHRLIGLGVGLLAIQVLNLVRIISLFYLGQWDMTLFEWAHLYLWQALIMLDALVVFVVWLRYLPRHEAAAAA
jgi:exosortase H (IPTLxxWG-CTERM-specific)